MDGDGNTVLTSVCPPPTLHVTSDVLKEGMEPSSNWSTYLIKLHENGKEYSMYPLYRKK